VSDFSSSQDPTLPSFPRRTLSGEEAAALDLSEIGGGVQGVFVRTPDGALTHLVLRPLLPDEVN
jgi:hypothetical protein